MLRKYNNISGILEDVENIPDDIYEFAKNFRNDTSYKTQSINTNVNANNILQYTKERLIQYGDRGQIVSDLEHVLYLLGYKTYSGSKPDGIFGNEVKSAVESIQTKNGIVSTGSVGAMTARLLYNLISNTKTGVSIPKKNSKTNSSSNKKPDIILSDIKKYWWMPAILLAVLLVIKM